MKKVLLSITVLSLLLGCASLSSQAISESVERGYISISTSANADVAPDIAEVSIAVTTYDSKSMQKATAENKEISDKVITSLKSKINAANGDYIKTADFSASPIYVYSGSKRNFDKYQVSNSIIVKTKSIDKVGSMIDTAISLGATNVNSLTFSVSNYEAQCNELLSTAVKKASNRANSIAKAVPTTITGVRTMDVNCSPNNSVRPQYRLMMANKMLDSAEAGSSSTIIESGVVKIYANVNATFFVK